MTLIETLTAIRENAIAELVRARALYPSSHIEPAYRSIDGALAVEGTWMLPCRADVLPVAGESGGVPITVGGKSLIHFDCRDLQMSKGIVRICPFCWNALTLSIWGLETSDAQAVLVPWFRKWFDEDDENDVNAEGLYGVVHYMSDAELGDDKLRVHLDLGSAPVPALEELLDFLFDAGALQVHLV